MSSGDFETIATSELQTAARGPAGEPGAPNQIHTMESKPRSSTADAWRELRRKPLFWIAVLIALVVIVMAAFPSLFTSANPESCTLGNRLAGPSGAAIF